jgi:hypothetical protein
MSLFSAKDIKVERVKKDERSLFKSDKNYNLFCKIRRRQFQILIHSCIYYELDNSLITDEQFDKWCYELVKLQQKYPKTTKKTDFYKVFKDFDGHTGYHLMTKLKEVGGNWYIKIYGLARYLVSLDNMKR